MGKCTYKSTRDTVQNVLCEQKAPFFCDLINRFASHKAKHVAAWGDVLKCVYMGD